jgi:hypothetical protein
MQHHYWKAVAAAIALAAVSHAGVARDALPVIGDIDTPSGWQLNGTDSTAARSSACLLSTLRLPFDGVAGYYLHVSGARGASAVSVSFSADEFGGGDIHDATDETLTLKDADGHVAVYRQPVPDADRNVRINDFVLGLSVDHAARDTFLERLGRAVSVTGTVEASPSHTWTLDLEDSAAAVAAFEQCMMTIHGQR